jgi:dipeptidyl aminopeptidase/acylaminoacyl peptidase
VRTPTLVLSGKEDIRTPLGQSEQWYYALRRVGVEAELVIYPGEGHSFTAASWSDVWRRALLWYRRYLLGQAEEPAELATTAVEASGN